MSRAFANDHLAWDFVEAVTLEGATRAGPRLCSVARAKRRNVRGSQKSPSGGVYVGYEMRWHVPAPLLPEGWVPKPRDAVLDGGGRRWTVLTVEHNNHGLTWMLGCVDLVLALDLRDEVVVERAALSQDDSGVTVKAFPPGGGRDLYTVAARVQEITRDIADERGVRYAKGRFEVTVDRQMPDVEPGEDRVRWADRGTVRYLDILAYRQPDRIDELPVLECELRL